jgi:hypothetical protein
LTKLSDFVLKRLVWKGISGSRSRRIPNFSRMDKYLGSELLHLEISVVFFFLSSLSGFSITIAGSRSGCDLVEIILGARTIDFILPLEILTTYIQTLTTYEHYFQIKFRVFVSSKNKVVFVLGKRKQGVEILFISPPTMLHFDDSVVFRTSRRL